MNFREAPGKIGRVGMSDPGVSFFIPIIILQLYSEVFEVELKDQCSWYPTPHCNNQNEDELMHCR